MVACHCEVCTSPDPRDKRLRPSLAIHVRGGTVLIDTSPELRLQSIANGLERIDAVLFTHTHADHTHGIDDLRGYTLRQEDPIPLYGSRETMEDLERRFSYIFHPTWKGGGLPQLSLNPVDGPFPLLGETVTPIPVLHGAMPIYGYRIGSFALVTDCSLIPASSEPLLAGLDVLVLDALRYREHPTHFNVSQALEVVSRLRPRKTYLTHVAHDLLHARDGAKLPQGVELAYDGLSVEIQDGDG